jgi:2-hydroxycyclohexanecarboxyl-CoA dehydrogenase
VGSGRVAVVTGGNRGLGYYVCRDLARLGLTVVLTSRDEAKGRAAAAELGRAGSGLDVRYHPLEVTDYPSVRRLDEHLRSSFGRLDVLVNNAGGTPSEPFAASAPDTWRRIVDVNFLGVLNCTRAALPVMIGRGGGRIIGIASDAARVGTPREAVYAGAKAAVIGFSKSLAAEVARHGITVNVVSPATVDTPLLRGMLTAEQIERREKANPMGRLGRPEDVAAAVAFFASPQAGYVTGQVLSVNGGVVRAG